MDKQWLGVAAGFALMGIIGSAAGVLFGKSFLMVGAPVVLTLVVGVTALSRGMRRASAGLFLATIVAVLIALLALALGALADPTSFGF